MPQLSSVNSLVFRDFLLQIKYHTGHSLLARTVLTVARRLPGLSLLARGLGRIGPVINLALAGADLWMALEDIVAARREPALNRIFRATMSSLLACCSIICALNIPLLSQVLAIVAVVIDFLKQMGLALMGEGGSSQSKSEVSTQTGF
jgi:hypothetical protein